MVKRSRRNDRFVTRQAYPDAHRRGSASVQRGEDVVRNETLLAIARLKGCAERPKALDPLATRAVRMRSASSRCRHRQSSWNSRTQLLARTIRRAARRRDGFATCNGCVRFARMIDVATDPIAGIEYVPAQSGCSCRETCRRAPTTARNARPARDPDDGSIAANGRRANRPEPMRDGPRGRASEGSGRISRECRGRGTMGAGSMEKLATGLCRRICRQVVKFQL